MADYPEELLRTRKMLEGVAGSARDRARENIRLAARAEDGVRYLNWLEETWPSLGSQPLWYSSSSAAAYQHELNEASAQLDLARAPASSAMSRVESVVSGSTGMVTSAAQQLYVTTIRTGDIFKITLPDVDRADSQSELDQRLESVWGSSELGDKRRGAWETFHRAGEDSAAQAAHTLREILTSLLDRFAENDAVKRAAWWKAVPDTREGVSKRQKVRFFAIGHQEPPEDEIVAEVARQVKAAVELHGEVIKIAHHNTAESREVVRTYLIALEDAMHSLLELRTRLYV